MTEATNPTNINDTFFNELYRDVWRKLIPAGLTEAEADFLEDAGQLAPNSLVLDLMCGYGRHTLELARRGHQVTAIDNSSDYIKEVISKSEAAQLPVEAVCSGAVDVNLTKVYDLAVCMGNSFAFFNEEETLSILHKLSASIKPGGRFIINTWMLAEIAIRHFRERDWFFVDDYRYVTENVFHFHPTRIETDHILMMKDGTWQCIKGVDYIFTVAELESFFLKTGFRLTGLYSTPRKKKFKLGDTRVYIVAEKV
jgi:2-polyprenyl-3-methyl-5-hydroxy-6-metoxy-1,4-benzoquinol methylase